MSHAVLQKLTESAEAAASSKTLDAFAEVIGALAPEVVSVSFHDVAADTLLLSEDFLPPEDHQLVEDCLAPAGGGHTIQYGTREGSRYSIAIPVRDSRGEVNGAVRLSIDSQVRDPRLTEPLEQRLAPVMVCLAAEFERRNAQPVSSAQDEGALSKIVHALTAERFELFLQAIRSLSQQPTCAHYEVLLRLRTADGGLLEPKAFLAAAAHRELLPTIDRWVVRALTQWLRTHWELWSRVPTVFSVNVAPQSITDADFIDFVEHTVTESGVPAQALCFEVTERFAASGNISVAESMRRLEALGCEVALDDFGASAPSYGYLRRVPAHYFKIDGSLVVAAPTDRVARAIISSIVRMAGDLGVRTVAESVESEVELEAVRALGVDYAQGYLFGRPSSLAAFDFEDTDAH